MLKNIPLLSETPAVIASIDSELSYHNSLTNTRTDDIDYGVPGQIVTLNKLVQDLNDAWYSSAGSTAAIEILLKIAATAARALILYGVCARRRDGKFSPVYKPESITNADQ